MYILSGETCSNIVYAPITIQTSIEYSTQILSLELSKPRILSYIIVSTSLHTVNMSARKTAADVAYEAQDDIPTGRVVDNSYAMNEPAGPSERRGAGPGGPVGEDTVNPVVRDDEPVEDPIDPNVDNDSDEMLGV